VLFFLSELSGAEVPLSEQANLAHHLSIFIRKFLGLEYEADNQLQEGEQLIV